MKSIIFLLFLLLPLLFITAEAQEESKKEIKREKFDPSRNPSADLKAAVNEARKSGRNILLDVGGEWCIWCHRMDEFIEADKEIKDLIEENYIVVKVNYSPENKNEEFLKQYPAIAGYPHIFVLDINGKFLHSQNTGDLESGKGYDRDKFIGFLNKWNDKRN